MKLKVKEMVEFTKELTIEERCLNLVYGTSIFQMEFRAVVKDKLLATGMAHPNPKNDYEFASICRFRREVIRDATPNEYDAWCVLFRNEMVCKNGTHEFCNLDKSCILGDDCPMRSDRYAKAEEILKGKEIIEVMD